jgi:hypothetical protein
MLTLPSFFWNAFQNLHRVHKFAPPRSNVAFGHFLRCVTQQFHRALRVLDISSSFRAQISELKVNAGCFASRLEAETKCIVAKRLTFFIDHQMKTSHLMFSAYSNVRSS